MLHRITFNTKLSINQCHFFNLNNNVNFSHAVAIIEAHRQIAWEFYTTVHLTVLRTIICVDADDTKNVSADLFRHLSGLRPFAHVNDWLQRNLTGVDLFVASTETFNNIEFSEKSRSANPFWFSCFTEQMLQLQATWWFFVRTQYKLGIISPQNVVAFVYLFCEF